MERLQSFLGIFAFIFIAYLFSTDRKRVCKKTVLWGIALQIIFALLVLGIPVFGITAPLRPFFQGANNVFLSLMSYTEEGSRFVFGSLLSIEKSGFIFAFQVLPSIIFFSSLMAILYHLGVMQKIVHALALVMHKTMKISGAESLSTAANIFVGQTEAPLLIRPYLNTMTRSEILCIMVGGMANVAGGVLAAYVGLLKGRIPDIAGHLLTVSVMSAPATILISKILIPENEEPSTLGHIPRESEKIDVNVIEATARGATEGLYLALNVATMLIAFIALVALLNGILAPVGLTLQGILGWIFSPFAFLLGIPKSELLLAGGLLGEKTVLNEFVAYLHLSEIAGSLSDRTVIILSYALCGFANFASIGIQVGGIGTLAPEKRGELAKLGLRAVLGGTLATFICAAIAGILI